VASRRHRFTVDRDTPSRSAGHVGCQSFKPLKPFARDQASRSSKAFRLCSRPLQARQNPLSNALPLELGDRAEDVHLQLPRADLFLVLANRQGAFPACRNIHAIKPWPPGGAPSRIARRKTLIRSGRGWWLKRSAQTGDEVIRQPVNDQADEDRGQ